MKDSMYVVTADYRPHNPNKPKYYVIAGTIKEAKAKFSAVISWLKIYSIELVAESESADIMKHPDKHIIIE